MRLCVLPAAAAAALLMGFAPAPLPKKQRSDPRDDLEKMQGVWRMTSYVAGGSPIDHSFKVRIRGKLWTFIHARGNEPERESTTWQLALDQGVHPRAFEWAHGEGRQRSGYVGSYRLEDNGKKLTVLYASGTLDDLKARPVDFNSASNRMTLVYLGR